VVNKLIKIALIGNTNAGKSTLMNSMVGKTVSIINKKINTTQNIIKGIVNINDTQIIFFDTPGSNFLNSSVSSQKKLKIDIWTAIEDVDCILYIIDVSKYNYKAICSDIKKINEVKKSIIVIFNKNDLIDNKFILPYIKSLNNLNLVEAFFNISAKYRKGLKKLSIFIKSKAQYNEWIFDKGEISNKDHIFMANECTRNAILKYLHKEIPYNIIVRNLLFKSLNNNDIKIKQSIDLTNMRYKPIILGKKGGTIKRIREYSQNEISNIMKSKIHLYLQVNKLND
jgi:GTP-binding protein Era